MVMKWPADKVMRRKVADLAPYARNSRTHSDEQVAQIANLITEFGWTTPVIIDESGGIISGHGRVLAAQQLGLAEVPAVVARGWSEAQKRAYVIADNKVALNAGWDLDLLQAELVDLGEMGFDVALTGFGPDDLAPGDIDPGSAPPADPIGTVPTSNYSEQYGVIVICSSEAAQKEAYEALMALGYSCKVVTT